MATCLSWGTFSKRTMALSNKLHNIVSSGLNALVSWSRYRMVAILSSYLSPSHYIKWEGPEISMNRPMSHTEAVSVCGGCLKVCHIFLLSRMWHRFIVFKKTAWSCSTWPLWWPVESGRKSFSGTPLLSFFFFFFHFWGKSFHVCFYINAVFSINPVV